MKGNILKMNFFCIRILFLVLFLSLTLNSSAIGFTFGYNSGYLDAQFTKEVTLSENFENALQDPGKVIAIKLSASNKNLAALRKFRHLKYLMLDETFVADGFYLSNEALEAFFTICDELPELEYLAINDSRLMALIKTPQRIKGLKINKYEWNTFQNNIEKFKNLELLIIEDQELNAIPNTVGTIITLKQIEINTVSMPQLPDLSMLQNLVVFKAELGKIKKLPSTFAALKSIKYLSITGMVVFEEFPKEICNIESLEELHIELRNANPIPDEIGNLSHLKNIYLVDCQNISKLPVTIGKLKNLEFIYLSDAKNSLDITPLINLEHQYSLMLVRCNYNGFAKQLENSKTLKNLILPTSILPSELNRVEKYIPKEKIIKKEL